MRKVFFGSLALAGCLSPSLVNAADTVSYTYDAVGRLVTLTTSGSVNNGESVTVIFDKAGNRVTYVVSGA